MERDKTDLGKLLFLSWQLVYGMIVKNTEEYLVVMAIGIITDGNS